MIRYLTCALALCVEGGVVGCASSQAIETPTAHVLETYPDDTSRIRHIVELGRGTSTCNAVRRLAAAVPFEISAVVYFERISVPMGRTDDEWHGDIDRVSSEDVSYEAVLVFSGDGGSGVITNYPDIRPQYSGALLMLGYVDESVRMVLVDDLDGVSQVSQGGSDKDHRWGRAAVGDLAREVRAASNAGAGMVAFDSWDGTELTLLSAWHADAKHDVTIIPDSMYVDPTGEALFDRQVESLWKAWERIVEPEPGEG